MSISVALEQSPAAKNVLPYAVQILIGGRVQAVGFRPFIYRLAKHYNLSGQVKNLGATVLIMAQGRKTDIERFQVDLINKAPPLASPTIIRIDVIPSMAKSTFSIESSESAADMIGHIPADYYLCDDCLKELFDPSDRRYLYPLISCTQCGPRFTVIEALPYDRPNTTLKKFPLCAECEAEYNDPGNRRYHAQSISCHHCGPQLTYIDQQQSIENNNPLIISHAVKQLQAGIILAVKGIGGYHLLCDATNENAVDVLRLRKKRPHKPFAVMLPLQQHEILLQSQCNCSQSQLDLLQSAQRPIVLLEKSNTHTLAAGIAPGLNSIGVLLPYSPLHTLLSSQFGKPLVTTSGNISGEPVIIDNTVAEEKLAAIADEFIHHDREIGLPVDDSVFHLVNQQPQPLRLGRGHTPLELDLPFTVDTATLALGAMFKNTIALAWKNRLIVSPHIGDMDSPQSLRAMENVIEHLQRVYQIKAEQILYDAHPRYTQTRWLRKLNLPAKPIFHHYAHASALAFEQPRIKQWLMFTWDGTGYGPDKTIWGGETFTGSPGHWQRVCSLKPFYLPGGDNVSRKPWLSALSLCWEAGIDFNAVEFSDSLKQQWQQRINCPQSTSMGRVFDAASAMLGLVNEASFEAQAPMLLQAHSQTTIDEFVDLPLQFNRQQKIWQVDWSPVLKLLLDSTLCTEQRAGAFHLSLAQMVCQQVKQFRQQYAFDAVGFCGGVFQNSLLCSQIKILLDEDQVPHYFSSQLPCNDASICVGQINEYFCGKTP